MKIIFSSASGNDKGEGGHYRRVLQRLGHQVIYVSEPSRSFDEVLGKVPEAGYLSGTSINGLLKLCQQDVDLFLYVEPLGLIPEGMKNAPFTTACVISDVHRNLKPRLELAQFFDHVFLYQRNYRRHFVAHPREHINWLPYACDLEVFHPSGDERDIDVAFIGVLTSDERREIIPKLAKIWHMNEIRYYLQNEIPYIYSRAKIVLDLPLGDDLNFRFFEAMSCGAMLLTRRSVNGQETLFEENKHFVAFDSEEELFEKLTYYLAHNAEREAIALTGLAEIQKHHSLEQRLEMLLDTVIKHPEQVAPIRSMNSTMVDRQYAWLYEYWNLVDPALALLGQARQAKKRWVHLMPFVLRTLARRLKNAR